MTAAASLTKLCGAQTRAGAACKRPAGWGTDHVGFKRCKLHGGRSPTGNGAGHRAMALAFARGALGAEVDIDPLQGMLLSVRLAGGVVMYHRLRLQGLADDADPAAINAELDRALVNLNRFCKNALDAGVDAKRVAIEERMAEAISLAAEDGLRELKLTAKQRAAFTTRFVAALADVEGTATEID